MTEQPADRRSAPKRGGSSPGAAGVVSGGDGAPGDELGGLVVSPAERRLLRVGHYLGTRIVFTVTVATTVSVVISCGLSFAFRGFVAPMTPVLAAVCCVGTALPVHLVLRSFTLLILRQRQHLVAQQGALSRLNALLSRSNTDLEAFSHRVAHDLRNPLTVVKIISAELNSADGLERDDVRAMTSDLDEAADRANSIVSSILTLSQARQSPPALVACSPSRSLDLVLKDLERKLKMAETRLERVDDARVAALGHPPWLERAWVNLIDNALQYGGSGGRVEVGVEQIGDQVRCWVSDDGPGIPSHVREGLQADFKSSSKGFGIGLAMVVDLVGHMNGRVHVSEGPGCTVSLWLDAARRGESPEP